MRFIFILTIIFAVAFIYLSFHFRDVDSKLNAAIHEQYDSVFHLRNDPAKDSSENRKIRAQHKLAINKKIDALNSRRHNEWWWVGIIVLGPVAGGSLLGHSLRRLFKKKTA